MLLGNDAEAGKLQAAGKYYYPCPMRIFTPVALFQWRSPGALKRCITDASRQRGEIGRFRMPKTVGEENAAD
jgi:hypothetical protein